MTQTLQVPAQYGLRPPDVARAFGSSEAARRAVYHGWLVPILRQKKLTLFDSGDVAACWQRIRSEGLPPPVPRKPSLAR